MLLSLLLLGEERGRPGEGTHCPWRTCPGVREGCYFNNNIIICHYYTNTNILIPKILKNPVEFKILFPEYVWTPEAAIK